MPFNNKLFINSDHSILIEFDGDISEKLLRYILGAAESIEQSPPTGFIELVPAYNSLLIIFEPLEFQPEQALSQVETTIKQAKMLDDSSGTTIEIPVCYDERVAEDINYVADYCSMTVKELIEAHSSQEYTVYMLGFLPGFLYLGGLDERLHCPRRDNPRTKIELALLVLVAIKQVSTQLPVPVVGRLLDARQRLCLIFISHHPLLPIRWIKCASYPSAMKSLSNLTRPANEY